MLAFRRLARNGVSPVTLRAPEAECCHLILNSVRIVLAPRFNDSLRPLSLPARDILSESGAPFNESGEYVPDPAHVRARYRSGTSIVLGHPHFGARPSHAPPFAEGGRTKREPVDPRARKACAPHG